MEFVHVDIHKNQLKNEPYKGFLEWVKRIDFDNDNVYQKELVIGKNDSKKHMKIIIRSVNKNSFEEEKCFIEVEYYQKFLEEEFDLYYDLLENILSAQEKYYIADSIGKEIKGQIVSRNQIYMSTIAVVVRGDLVNVSLSLINQMVMIETSFQALGGPVSRFSKII